MRTYISCGPLIAAALLAATITGCNPYTTPGAAPGGGGDGGATGKLYVTAAGANSISRFDGAAAADGNMAPAAVIAGNLTGLNSPRFVLLDVVANRLYVTNLGGNSILIFNEISAKTGNIPPDRIIGGPATTLDGPFDVALDSSRNLLYVSNANASAILVFVNANTINGNVAPARTIGGSNTGLNLNVGVLLDALNNRLYVANLGGDSVVVFDNASTQSGNILPTRTLAGASTQFSQPIDLSIDLLNNLLVDNRLGVSINTFASASTVSGNAAPVRLVTGANTSLNAPLQTFFDSSTGQLYVANSFDDSVLVFNNISTSSGNLAPSRTISGGATGLIGPAGLALDTTR